MSQWMRTNLELAGSRKALGREANIEVDVTVRVVVLSCGLVLFSTDKQIQCAGLYPRSQVHPSAHT